MAFLPARGFGRHFPLAVFLVLLFVAFASAVPVPSGAAPHVRADPHGGPLSSTIPSSSSPAGPSVAQETITFYTVPGTCGAITFNGTNFLGGQVGSFPAGTYAVSATPCATWVLQSLVGGGTVSITGNTATIAAGTTGSVRATFVGYLYNIFFGTTPTTCGSISLNGSTFVNGGSTTSQPGTFPVVANPCPGYYTTSLTASGGISILTGYATVTNNGTIDATFAPKSFNITVDSNPAACGGINIGSKGIRAGTTAQVLAGAYEYTAWACVGYVLSSIAGSVNVSVNPWINGPQNGSIQVVGDGTVTLGFALEDFNVTFYTVVVGERNAVGGTITFDGQTFTNDTTAQFPYLTDGNVSANPRPNFEAAYPWGNVTDGVHWWIYQQSIIINGTGTITAYFIPLYYNVEFTTDQPACVSSTVNFNDSVYALIDYYGAHVLSGTYLVSGPFCVGFSFAGYVGSGEVAVTRHTGIVWVNGSGTITLDFTPNWIIVSGSVENFVTDQPVPQADVFIIYGGTVVNQTGPTGKFGNWSLRLTYGGYFVNSTAPFYTSAPQEYFFVNGTPSGISGFIVWINNTLGLPSTPPGLLGFVSTFPGILVPIGIIIGAIAVVLVFQMSLKWSRLEATRREQRLQGPPPPGPPGTPLNAPGPVRPGMPPPGTPQLPPGRPPYPPAGYAGPPPPPR